MRTFTPQDWIKNFRMSRETFDYLCHRLYPILKKENTVMQQSISVQQQVAITLWCLATPTEYHTIAHLFGVARSTVCAIVHKACLAIVENLMGTYIKFPRGDQLERVTESFQTKWGVPQCVGAIDVCHIPIAAPVSNH